MASAYHNLMGWLRDCEALKKAEGGSAIRDRLAEVAEWILDDLVGEYEETPEPGDYDDDATDGDTLAVASNVADVRSSADGGASRPATRSDARGAPASVLDRALDLLPREERSEAIAELDLLRMHSVGSSVRRACKPVTENKNRGKK